MIEPAKGLFTIPDRHLDLNRDSSARRPIPQNMSNRSPLLSFHGAHVLMDIDDDKSYIFTIPQVLSGEECRQLILRIEEAGPTIATINTAIGAQVKTNVRNNERVIFEDQQMADDLFSRTRERIPEEIHGLQIHGLNEMFRCYRYQPGMRFAPHADAPFVRNNRECSCYTFMIYLNDDFEGGSTTFLVEPEVSITPETGKALLFQHALIHEGAIVTAGTKYVLRSDVMYRAKSR